MPLISFVSVIDPGNPVDPTFETLQRQSLDDWEWVLVTRGASLLPDGVTNHERVRIIAAPADVAAAGEYACANFGMAHATGSYVGSLDIGDRLTDSAVAVFAVAAESEPDALYCDVANFGPEAAALGFSPEFGWRDYEVVHDGSSLRAIQSFPLTASSLAEAPYAPSYGIFWHRHRLVALGGMRDEFGAAAPYELLVRAYLEQCDIVQIEQALVVSRRMRETRRDPVAEASVSDAYRYQLITEWSRRNGLRMLDLGAAHNPAPGFESVDLQDAQINCDLRYGFPLPDESVGCVRAWDFLEHMHHCPNSACTHGADGVSPRCTVGLMNEIYRVLAPGGWIVSRTPSSDGRGAFQDPTHVSFWNPNSFWYYTRQEQARFLRGVECRYQANRVWQAYPDAWHEEHRILYVHAELVALKGQPQPGRCEI